MRLCALFDLFTFFIIVFSSSKIVGFVKDYQAWNKFDKCICFVFWTIWVLFQTMVYAYHFCLFAFVVFSLEWSCIFTWE